MLNGSILYNFIYIHIYIYINMCMCVSYLVKTVYPAGLQVDFNISVLSDEHGTADERALVAELALQNISDEALLVALNGALSSEGPGEKKKGKEG